MKVDTFPSAMQGAKSCRHTGYVTDSSSFAQLCLLGHDGHPCRYPLVEENLPGRSFVFGGEKWCQ